MNTAYRDSCGSLRGMVAHQVAGETPCGWCVAAEAAARLSAEAITWRPAPAGWLEPVSREQAAMNAAILDDEARAWEQANPGASDRQGRRSRKGGRHLHAA